MIVIGTFHRAVVLFSILTPAVFSTVFGGNLWHVEINVMRLLERLLTSKLRCRLQNTVRAWGHFEDRVPIHGYYTLRIHTSFLAVHITARCSHFPILLRLFVDLLVPLLQVDILCVNVLK